MFKKMMAFALLSASALYADVALDLHVTITKDDVLVKDSIIQIVVVEGVSTVLQKTETYQAVGLVNPTSDGVTLELTISTCQDGVCEPVCQPGLDLTWNKTATLNLADLLGNVVHVECIATPVITD
jgi:hypothetical protein